MKKIYFNEVEIEGNSENYFTFSMYRGVLTINMHVIGIYENIPALFFEDNIPMLTKAEQEAVSNVRLICIPENYAKELSYGEEFIIPKEFIIPVDNEPEIVSGFPKLVDSYEEIPEIWCRENPGCLYGPHYDSTLYEIWDYYNGIFGYIYEHNHKFWNRVKVFVN